MAQWAAVQNWTNTATGSGNTVTNTFGLNPTPGNILVACGMNSSGSNTLTIADTIGDLVNWSVAVGPIYNASNSNGCYIWFKVVGATVVHGAVTITESAVGTSPKELFTAEYSGNNATQTVVLDGTNNAKGTGAIVSPGYITTQGWSDIVIGFQSNSDAIPAAIAPLVSQSTQNGILNDSVGDIQNAAQGSWLASWALENGWTALAAAFRAPGPTITTQPNFQTCYQGQTATFTVAASALSGSLTYQWQANSGSGFVNVSGGSGATTASYTTGTTNNSQDANGTIYQCAVTDSTGTAYSNSAGLTVLETSHIAWTK